MMFAISKQFKDHWQRITVIGCDYMTQSQSSDGDASHCNEEHIEILKDLGIDVMASLQWKPGAHDPKNYSINKLGNSNLAPQHIVPRAGSALSISDRITYKCTTNKVPLIFTASQVG